MAVKVQPFSREFPQAPHVRGHLHWPSGKPRAGLVFAHGAGGDSNSPLLTALAEALAAVGFAALRCDLPYRQRRPKGPPSPAGAPQDREGLRRAAAALREAVQAPLLLGGQSYGGRQATLVCADDPQLAAGLLLTSYPLHPPGKPERPRTDHFPKLQTPALFVHGTKDPFGSIEELRDALRKIPAPSRLIEIEDAGHGLARKGKKGYGEAVEKVRDACLDFFELV